MLRDRTGGNQPRHVVAGRPQRERGDARTVEDGRRQRVDRGEQPSRHRVFHQGGGREAPAQRLDRERHVEERGAGTALALGYRHAGGPDRDQLFPEVGGEPERFVLPEPVERTGAVGESAEHVDDRALLVSRVEIHSRI